MEKEIPFQRRSLGNPRDIKHSAVKIKATMLTHRIKGKLGLLSHTAPVFNTGDKMKPFFFFSNKESLEKRREEIIKYQG